MISEVIKSMPKPEEKGEICSLNIERAANGFSVNVRYKPKKSSSKKSEMIGSYIEPEEYVFESADAVKTFVKDVIDELKDEGGSPEEEDGDEE